MSIQQAVRNILIVGGGACGGFHGARLALGSGAGINATRVSVVCGGNRAAVQRDGYKVSYTDAKADADALRFRPQHVFGSTLEAAAANVDWHHVMVFTKAVSDSTVVRVLEPLLSAGAARDTAAPGISNTASIKTISLWQNGIGIESSLAAFLAAHSHTSHITLVSAVMYVGISLREKSGAIIDANRAQRALLGIYPTQPSTLPSAFTPETTPQTATANNIVNDSNNLADLAALLAAAKLNAEILPNIQVARWHKNLWNATIGLLGLAGSCAPSDIVLNTQMPQVIALMNEVAATAHAVLGKPLPFDTMGTFEDLVTLTRTMGSYKASILLDWEAGRDIELQVIVGNVLEAAKLHNVATPRLEALYAVVQLMQEMRTLNT
ncbi:hypothetical protein HK100_004057 [Physocladia obscura]|uniref:2-dehydropantoate 2-reductase n=1 Tax=Physocladia obscura TaxID=109957 RepID=A0AAD5SUA8_9FUNG|nr:hypothetical protein HK100_004057 [Physocladia obscura]